MVFSTMMRASVKFGRTGGRQLKVSAPLPRPWIRLELCLKGIQIKDRENRYGVGCTEF